MHRVREVVGENSRDEEGWVGIRFFGSKRQIFRYNGSPIFLSSVAYQLQFSNLL